MHGVIAPVGQTAPPFSSVKVCSDTPYCMYSTLVGGGSAGVSAFAGRATPIVIRAQTSAKTTLKAGFR
jgi:hypothetical protein